MVDEPPGPFGRLDFIYTPSRDVAADVEHFTSVLGARLGFAIEAFGTRVAMLHLGDTPPDLLRARGWHPEPRFGIPHGPCCSFRTPGGHRLAIYQLTRPQAADHFAGRRDF